MECFPTTYNVPGVKKNNKKTESKVLALIPLKTFKMNETNCISKFRHWDYLCQKMKQKYWYLMFEITNYKNGPNLAFSESV